SLMSALLSPTTPSEGTRLQLNVTAAAVVLVTVTLSIMVLALAAMYWFVCAASNCLEGIIHLTLTAIRLSTMLRFHNDEYGLALVSWLEYAHIWVLGHRTGNCTDALAPSP